MGVQRAGSTTYTQQVRSPEDVDVDDKAKVTTDDPPRQQQQAKPVWGATGAQKGRPVDAEKAKNEATVGTWTDGWKTTLVMPSPEKLKELKADALDAIKTAQSNFTEENKHADPKLTPRVGETMRAQHARAVYATADGKFTVNDKLPDAIAKGPFAPSAEPLRALVRISNVSGTVQKDGEKDLRGFALRLTDDKGHVQDIMMNTSETFMAKDADGAIVGVRVRGQGKLQLGKAVLDGQMGLGDAIDLAKRGKAVQTNDISDAAHTYWSRTPFQLGDKAVKLRLVPVNPHSDQPLVHGDNELENDMRMRLQKEPVKYELQVQGYINEQLTPINDASKPWKSEYVTVGTLELPELPKSDAKAKEMISKAEGDIDKMAYSISNRWTKDDGSLKGLGDINYLRRSSADGGAGVYETSAEGRGVKGTSGLRCPLGYG